MVVLRLPRPQSEVYRLNEPGGASQRGNKYRTQKCDETAMSRYDNYQRMQLHFLDPLAHAYALTISRQRISNVDVSTEAAISGNAVALSLLIRLSCAKLLYD
jgi:hypothetical protein